VSTRAVVLTELLAYECNPQSAQSSDTGGSDGSSSGTTIISIGDELDLSVVIAPICTAFALFLCCGFTVIWYYKRKLDLAAAFKNARLPDNVLEVLEAIYTQVFDLDAGEVAQYIPELRNATPERFGIVLCDLEGSIYSVGDTEVPVTIQSVCKPILYTLALDAKSKAEVTSRIGEEPSGLPFDDVSIDSQNRAFNPCARLLADRSARGQRAARRARAAVCLTRPATTRVLLIPRACRYVNAGAIVSASMLDGMQTAEERFDFFAEQVKMMCADPSRCQLDEATYTSEMATNSNNRMITETLRAKGIIQRDADVALDAYTRACSLNVTAEDVAVMAATFANGGVNPVTERAVLSREVANHTVTVMMSCGMYNGAGRWIVDVGIPAKSGVAGLVMCVVPGVCGFAVLRCAAQCAGAIVTTACCEPP
jgi:glutaminase